MNERQSRIFERVVPIAIKHAHADVSRITPETNFVNDLGFDSLTAVEFIMAVEDEFGVSVPDEVSRELHTVGEVEDYITQHTADDGGAAPAAASPRGGQ
jgi:acyl carrier protein